MKPNASVLAVAGAISLALVGMTVACQSSVTPPGASTSAPIAAPASPSPLSPSPAASPTTTRRTIAQKQTTDSVNSSSAVNRTVESCVVKMALVDDPKPPLNVRSAPTADGDNVVGQLKNGTLMTITDDQNGWLQIKSPLRGWVSKQQTVNSCNQKVERIRLSADGTAVQVADRFVGTGSHRYVIAANQGQTLMLTRDHGPFPILTAPDGTVLLGHDRDEKRSNWSGKLAQTGDYIVELESNFRGYRYAFSMQIK